ncbi:hypothetical protein H1Z61_03945 [Bacillus aquiflavi]|uniref:Threonine dehydratase n=1 Tax=Bacillus aquiflavi TaxID=2672567 RepID=A0A6B3VYL8_9BACI|nr:hypothetical protein [Bacillus aquiflavi]MBA4536313.1 hypothetical protein [Bacillus aquiflavi]NEY80681.1 hypothetical protein [Bacillus aquiflavi]UAC48850.1 hypothetical protein K6959_02570 [Bacillus aquiflavi]
MEYLLSCKGSAYPCEVTIDEDNGRYMLRKADSSGEYFNTPEELVTWIFNNWKPEQFYDEKQFGKMLNEIQVYSKK